jgi:hypothetical protein
MAPVCHKKNGGHDFSEKHGPVVDEVCNRPWASGIQTVRGSCEVTPKQQRAGGVFKTNSLTSQKKNGVFFIGLPQEAGAWIRGKGN